MCESTLATLRGGGGDLEFYHLRDKWHQYTVCRGELSLPYVIHHGVLLLHYHHEFHHLHVLDIVFNKDKYSISTSIKFLLKDKPHHPLLF